MHTLGIEERTAASTQGSSSSQTMTRDKEWIPSDLVPADKNKIVKEVAVKHWGHANHLNKDFPNENPMEKDLETYCSHLMKIHDTTIKSLRKRLLEHLLNLAREKELDLPVNPEKRDKEKALTIDRVHSLVLNSSKVCNKEYLSRVLEYLKMPQKQERGWLQLATNDVTEQFQVRFMHDGHKKLC